LRELQLELSRYADQVDVDPARLAELDERLNLIHSLKRKYGSSLGAVIEFGAAARTKLGALESRDAEVARLNAALTKVEAELTAAGRKLTAARRGVIPKLAKAVARQLAELGFVQSRFDIYHSEQAWAKAESDKTARPAPSLAGFDTIEFQFAPNVGEPLKPLRAIASSGEMARVMLALKTVLAVEDEIPVLVFDEVDANVGGETARAVGEKMKQIAAQRQVFCITHSPQVAAVADAHYVVTKQLRDGRTTSEITRLESMARVTELARMLGDHGEAARQHAAALLK
jgi:DNA repair protein RecN (Recombination protein N)